MTLLFGTTAAFFLVMGLVVLWHLGWVPRLPSSAELAVAEGNGESKADAIRCSVIIATRDEEARIEQTVRRLLGQEGIELEIVIVDDRSTDRTPEILRRLGTEDPRVQVRRVDVLAQGWLGKCHACHVGAQAATGDWLLFTDADCWLKPDVIARAVRVAERDHADHVTMVAGTRLDSVFARAWYLLFLTGIMGWLSAVNRDRPRSHVGIGAFNLVRAKAYAACGGYEALRLTVVDDIKLGLLLRRAGMRTRGFLGASDVECHWADSVAGMVRIMEKNYFAALDFRLAPVFAATLAVVLVATVLVLGLVSGTPTGLACVLSPFFLGLPAGVLARRLGWSWPCALWMPSMFPVFIYALLRSTLVTLRQGGIRWRDTFYPLAILRAGNVR